MKFAEVISFEDSDKEINWSERPVLFSLSHTEFIRTLEVTLKVELVNELLFRGFRQNEAVS